VAGRLASRIAALVGAAASSASEPEAKLLEQLNTQFGHFQLDAPACDICGAITVRNGTCYKCYNCGNSMGCS
jgi:ribonucleoside-diphosphate reductase alpha chain